MTTTIITPPASEPVTLSDAKAHLRVDATDEDALISAMIGAARETAEHMTGRAFITQTLELTLDAFPVGAIAIPRPNLLTVTSVKYDDTAGVEQTVSPADYVVLIKPTPGLVYPADGVSWPATRDMKAAVRVRYTAGYGASSAAVPAAIKSWMLLRVGALYKHREAFHSGSGGAVELPGSFVDSLLDPYRVYA